MPRLWHQARRKRFGLPITRRGAPKDFILNINDGRVGRCFDFNDLSDSA